MINITIYKRNNTYTGFSSVGHAGYAEHGEDIVCAGVSALVINTINSINALTETKAYVDMEEEEGMIHCNFAEAPDPGCVLLIDSMILGLQNLICEYENEYIRLNVKEV